MRAAALAVVAFCALAVPVGAARTWQQAQLAHKSDSRHASLSNRSASQHASGWFEVKEKFCMARPALLKCDSSSIIMVKKAFYQRRTTDDCKAEQHSEEADEELCKPDSALDVVSKCSGGRECTVGPEEHPWCPNKGAFTFFRAVWECIAGDPQTAIEDLQLTDNQNDEEELLPAPTKKRKEYVKGEVDKLLSSPDPEREAAFKTCYRYTRTSKVMSFRFFDPLTSCSSNEGCFKVTFPDGKVYDDPDPNAAPTQKELTKANYAEGKESYWLTWVPIDLQRNDFNTWGVCLPKGEGKDLAIATFDELKKGNKPKND